MATVSLTTSPTTLDSGASEFVTVVNAGTTEVRISRGGTELYRLQAGQSAQVYPEGTAITAVTVSGTGSVTTTAQAARSSQVAQFAADPAFTGTFLTQAAATASYAPKNAGTVMAPGPYRTGGTVFTGNLSNGTDTGVNTRSAHRHPQALTTLEVGYANYAANGAVGESTTATGTVTLRAAVEYPSGSYWPIRFSGKRDVSVEAGGYIVSDRVPVPGGIPAGSVFWVRTYATVTSGQKWGSGWAVDSASPWLEATQQSTTETDLTTSGTITGTAAAPLRPAVIRSALNPDTLRILGVGDSIISAVGDTTDPRRGWFGILTDNAVAAVRAGCSGERLTAFTGGGMQTRLAYAIPGTNVAICALGVNDVAGGANLATVQTRMQTLWEFLYRHGIKVWQTTITPYSVTTTDSYATTANQTVHSSNTVRVALNDWLRSLTPGSGGGQYLAGIIEHADCAETARNSGLWKVTGAANYATADGTHPSTPIHTLMAAAVPLAALRTSANVTG